MSKHSTLRLCGVCGLAVRDGRSSRCVSCRQLIDQAANTGTSVRRTRIPASVAQEAIRQSSLLHQRIYTDANFGYACQYSQISLNTDKAFSCRGDYVSFDHVVPNNPEKAVLCSRIVNDIKGWMTDIELCRFVCEVMDVDASREMHGLGIQELREFLIALRTVMSNDQAGILSARMTLKDLSSRIQY